MPVRWEQVVDADSDEIFNWPWIYVEDPGWWDISEAAGCADAKLSVTGRLPYD